MSMRNTSTVTPNKIGVGLQSFKQNDDGYSLEICITLPSNTRGGVALIHEKDAQRYVRLMNRVKTYTADAFRWNKELHGSSDYHINYCVNGCTGVFVDGKGRVTQKKINSAIRRVASICGKMRLSD
jgi:hypothetical protein